MTISERPVWFYVPQHVTVCLLRFRHRHFIYLQKDWKHISLILSADSAFAALANLHYINGFITHWSLSWLLQTIQSLLLPQLKLHKTASELTSHEGRTLLQMQRREYRWSHCRRGWDVAVDWDRRTLVWTRIGCDCEPAADCRATSDCRTRCSHPPASTISRYCSGHCSTPSLSCKFP